MSIYEKNLPTSNAIQLHQVKGVRYDLNEFVGEPVHIADSNNLYSVVLYLSPANYHRIPRSLQLRRGEPRARAGPAAAREGVLREQGEGPVHAERARGAERSLAGGLLLHGPGGRVQCGQHPAGEHEGPRGDQPAERAAVQELPSPRAVRGAVGGESGREGGRVRDGLHGRAGIRGASVHVAGGARARR